jgi:hypothetical protein
MWGRSGSATYPGKGTFSDLGRQRIEVFQVDATEAFFYRRSCDELLALETLTTSKTKAELFVIEGVVML